MVHSCYLLVFVTWGSNETLYCQLDTLQCMILIRKLWDSFFPSETEMNSSLHGSAEVPASLNRILLEILCLYVPENEDKVHYSERKKKSSSKSDSLILLCCIDMRVSLICTNMSWAYMYTYIYIYIMYTYISIRINAHICDFVHKLIRVQGSKYFFLHILYVCVCLVNVYVCIFLWLCVCVCACMRAWTRVFFHTFVITLFICTYIKIHMNEYS